MDEPRRRLPGRRRGAARFGSTRGAAVLSASSQLGIELDVHVHRVELVQIDVVTALGELRRQRCEIARGELGDLLLELGSVDVVLDEEAVPRGGEDLAAAA
jgi:hypothetical protein